MMAHKGGGTGTAADAASPSDHIVLNLGGVRFETLRSTLCKYDDSMLAAMFSGRHAKPLPIGKDGVCFLDRSPVLFAIILEYLRQGTVSYVRWVAERWRAEASRMGS